MRFYISYPSAGRIFKKLQRVYPDAVDARSQRTASAILAGDECQVAKSAVFGILSGAKLRRTIRVRPLRGTIIDYAWYDIGRNGKPSEKNAGHFLLTLDPKL
jgi:hypothetical protein